MDMGDVRRIAAPRRAARYVTWTLRLGRQLVVILAAVFAYRLVRSATEGEHDVAIRHSLDVLGFERALGLDIELGVQAPVLRQRLLIDVANVIYTWGFWSIVALTLLVLYIVDRRRFRFFRNALFLSGAAGLAVFAAFPVAPPRMLDGFVDTVHRYSGSGGIAHPGSFTNVYAAMPSFHVGWLVLAGVSTMPVVPWRAVRPLLLLPAAVMTWTVMATANHYLLDGIAGAVVALAGLFVAQHLPTPALVWQFVDRRLQPFGGAGAVAARLGESVGRGLVPFVGGRAVHVYYSAASTPPVLAARRLDDPRPAEQHRDQVA